LFWINPFGIVYLAKANSSKGEDAKPPVYWKANDSGVANEREEKGCLRDAGPGEAAENYRPRFRLQQCVCGRATTGVATELMKVILLPQSSSAARHIEVSVPAIVAGICLSVAVLAGAVVYAFSGSISSAQPLAEVDEIQGDLAAQREELRDLRARAQEQIDALAIRMGELNARSIRLDALGTRLTEMADLEDGEFDFDAEPALGGPLEPAEPARDGQIADFFLDIESMDKALHDQAQQLSILEGLLMTRKLNERVSPKGRPVKAGYISSYFGHRADPFTGKGANHRGVDFAGKRGSEVIAVGAGVVSYSGPRYGYGNMVEVNHGNGYVTRYAHNEVNLVYAGESVQPGQTIALMGSTGRATGPNLHFEVRHQGRPVNPVKFIRQKG